MQCAFLGLAAGALALHEAGHELTAIGLCRKPRAETRDELCRILHDESRLFIQPQLTDRSIQKAYLGPKTPLVVCYFWDRILPAAFLQSCTAGAINVHPSLLPRHRGADPYFWTIWLGDKRAGVTVHALEAGLDTGPIIAQRAITVAPTSTGGQLAQTLEDLALELLLEVLEGWNPSSFELASSQDESLATAAPAPEEELLEIDWTRPAPELVRLIRAASPHPGAFTYLSASPDALVVLDAHVTQSGKEAFPDVLEPGLAFRSADQVIIWSGRDGVALDAVQLGAGPILRSAETIAEVVLYLESDRPLR